MTAVVKPEPVAIVPTEDQKHGILRLVASPDYLFKLQEETREATAKLLVQDRDFGTIPGVNKPSLWKSGAERLGVAFGLVPEYAVLTQEVDHDRVNEWSKTNKYGTKSGVSAGLYRYVVRCTLIDRAGQAMGSAVAACSTLESKYIDRPRDSENTVVQMAAKRAYIAAIRQTLGLSDQFTQDVEDQRERFAEEPEAQAAPATQAKPKAAAAKKMPFGKQRGVLLGDMKTIELAAACKWCRETNAEKFKDLIAALEEVLLDRANAAQDTLMDHGPEAEPSTVANAAVKKGEFESFKDSLEESSDDLPF